MAAFDSTLIARVATGLYNTQIGNATMDWALEAINGDRYSSVADLANDLYSRDFGAMANADVAAIVVNNVDITGAADKALAIAAVKDALDVTAANAKGAMVLDILNLFANMTAPAYAGYVAAFNAQVSAAVAWAQTPGTIDVALDQPANMANKVFTLTPTTAAGVDVMRLTGDQDVRIDFTNPLNQIRGLDLDGDGTIENDGHENNSASSKWDAADRGAGFEIVDAYKRDLLNEKATNNFLGDINFDGTGFAGDGVNTDGNIFLGGLGTDTAKGGIGNDFLAGGGVAQGRTGMDKLTGDRNADFFFAEFSALDATDGTSLWIDGGNTADNNSAGNGQSAQDADWLLFEASDDDEPVQVWLNDDNLADQRDAVDGLSDGMGRVLSRFGESMQIDDIENFDASGNLYGFLNGFDVAIGGHGMMVAAKTRNDGSIIDASDADAATAMQNVGIGSSAQLWISGSNAGNVIVGGYDNDYIEGRGGNDLLMGGNLNFAFNNPNASAGLVGNNNGRDEMHGGDGNDGIVFEADGGVISGGSGDDTLWLTRETLGKVNASTYVAAADVTTDSVLRFDLAAEVLASSAGYGGADSGSTQDQTNYKSGSMRVSATGMESVIATGLGAVDYKAAGANLGAPVTTDTPAFTNQQNHFAYDGDLDLRGTYADSVQTGNTSFTITLTIAGSATVFNATYAGTLSTAQAQARFFTENPALAGVASAVNAAAATAETVAVGGVNTLYAGAGDDVIEGRTGGTLTTNASGVVTTDSRDKLSGGAGSDDFIFALGVSTGDGVDVIHRQTNIDVDGDGNVDNITDGKFGVDFGEEADVVNSNSTFTISLPTTATPLVDGIIFVLGGTQYKVEGISSATFAAFNAALNTALDANPALAALTAVLNADNTIKITDPTGRTFEKVATGGWVLKDGVLPPDGTSSWSQTVGAPSSSQDQDRLIYAAYEDRADGELVDDGSYTGSAISLGVDSYAEDLVIDFSAGSTRIAEGQSYVLTFTNLTTEDKASITVNGITYTLRVGVDLDGNEIAGEELTGQGGTAASQAAIQTAFLARMAGFINTFMDDDTAAGSVSAAATATTITLTQLNYNGEETVFMRTPTVSLVNDSTGELPSVSVLNSSQHEVQLLNFEGRNGELNAANVLFWGNEKVSRSILETGLDTQEVAGVQNALTGSNALITDGGTNTLQPTIYGATTVIADNTATNAFLRTDFTAHGDDFLLGGKASEDIQAGTGDDRVIGSLGTDTVDGGRSYYAVRVLGEAQARVYTLNQWEATNPANPASPLAGLTISSINRIGDAESGNATPVSTGLAEVYNDTLQFQQGDFTTGATAFTINLNNFNRTTAGVIELRKGGAGTVSVDLAGDGGVPDAVTTFTNFENIRTISGTGTAVANDGQGNDTLDLSLLSDVVTGAGGVSYDLTSDVTLPYAFSAANSQAGEVRYSTNAILSTPVDTDGPAEGDYESLVIKVDGVENVITGTGADLLLIDETEAAKDNKFTAGLGVDRINYLNVYAGDVNGITEPTVTIKVDGIAASSVAGGVDTVTMTGGRVGQTVADDELGAVEYIGLFGNTANGSNGDGGRENDVIDVTSLPGATVSYVDGTVKEGATTHVTIDNLNRVENVLASATGSDTVIVASKASMGANARSDAGGSPGTDILLATYLDFDAPLTVVAPVGKRVPFAQQTSADITNAINQNQFTFSMGAGGSDTVDYSQQSDDIVAAVRFNATPDQYILVGAADLDLTDAGDRIDHLVDVENVVASSGNNSTLDLTASDRSLKITFSNNYDNVANWNASFNPGYGREIHTIKVADGVTGTSAISQNYIDYVYVDTSTTITDPVPQDARWNRIEGSDFNETVEFSGYEAFTPNTLNLRGGSNLVTYEGEYIFATLDVPTGFDFVTADVYHSAVKDDHNSATVDPVQGNWDVISSYSAQNGIASGKLTLKATRGAIDQVSFAAGLTEPKFFVFGGVTDATPSITVKIGSGSVENSIELVGFEYIVDATTDDTYDFVNLASIAPTLRLFDNGGPDVDHDTIKVNAAADAVAVDGAANGTISLTGLKTAFFVGGTFNWEVLDITNVSGNTVTAVTGDAVGVTDELVVGALSTGGVTSALNFESVVVTQALVTQAGTTITLNTTTNQVVAGAKTLTVSPTMTTLSLSGTALDGSFDPESSLAVTSAVTLNAVGTGNVTLIGGTGADSITGAGGDDVLRGAQGNDTLDGGFVPQVSEVQVVTLGGGILDAGDIITIEGVTIGVGQTVNVVAGASATQIANAFVTYANVPANLTALSTSLGEALTSVTYDPANQRIQFNFTGATGDVLNGVITLATALTTSTITATVFDNTPSLNGHVDFALRDESADTYVFEATRALNGEDTINNFDLTDTLDFTAYFDGAVVNTFTSILDNSAAWSFGGSWIVQGYNKATLAASDFNGAGEMSILDGSKNVFITTADADGVADATNQPYNVYYVYDSDETAGVTVTVELVGTVNSAAELTAGTIPAVG